MADQWYQKWSVVISIENMCNWVSESSLRLNRLFKTSDWFNSLSTKYHIHPDHLQLLQDICCHIAHWHQSNKSLTSKGIIKLNAIPFFPPTWFTNKSRQSKSEGLAPSYLATFAPPYRLPDQKVPERWDQVFLKGITVNPNQKV